MICLPGTNNPGVFCGCWPDSPNASDGGIMLKANATNAMGRNIPRGDQSISAMLIPFFTFIRTNTISEEDLYFEFGPPSQDIKIFHKLCS